MKILVLNAGSSSLKCSVYDFGGPEPDTAGPALFDTSVDWKEESERSGQIGKLIAGVANDHPDIRVIGHRVVHGGRDYSQPVRIDAAVKDAIARFAAFAPLHNQVDLEVIEATEKIIKDVPQIAVFDTAFHHSMPEEASVYAGPYAWIAQGIRRYGFHGINHEYCAMRAAQLLGAVPRLVSCHLGNGCSLAAIANGRSVDTTMGFTPLEGLVMGTRSGSVDPGILTYLLRQGVAGDRIDRTLNHDSGLLGISGISPDMRTIQGEMAKGNARARLAFDVFIHRLRQGIGAMLSVLGGADAVIFTAGIGEHSSEVRAAACANFAFAGLRLNEDRNRDAHPDCDIAAPESQVRVLVIKAQEDWAIARKCWDLLA